MGQITLYPAIDLKDGACVRLIRGEMDEATVFNTDPGAQAAAFRRQGFNWIHVVDLNGAFAGESRNAAAVTSILDAVDCPVQLGGGLRDMTGVSRWLEAGITRVILGTAAVKDPDFVKTAARTFPGQIVVGIDAKDGYVATDGWAETSTMPAVDLARAFEDCGVSAIVFTDISRDGTKTGVNVEATGGLADAVSIPIIASGGVRSNDDVTAIQAWTGTPIEGVILGRALYDGDIDTDRALKTAQGVS